MKKVLFVLFVFSSLWSCTSRNSEEAIRQKWIEKQMAREYKDAELDSLALIATGKDGDPSLVSPRYNALSVLRSELPEKKEVWDKVEKAIYAGDVYGDDEDEGDVFE